MPQRELKQANFKPARPERKACEGLPTGSVIVRRGTGPVVGPLVFSGRTRLDTALLLSLPSPRLASQLASCPPFALSLDVAAMKLDAAVLRYLNRDDFRVLTGE